mmetsp:Transcript_92637/g.266398  ORF Transcript_92637/g.266398 Transcript_92637/m.266398 type:complete len:290 (-) Transcript_92637:143-1012(-)
MSALDQLGKPHLPDDIAADDVLPKSLESAWRRGDGSGQPALVLQSAVRQGRAHDVVPSFVPGEGRGVWREGRRGVVAELGASMLDHPLRHEIAKGVLRQEGDVLQQLLGQRRCHILPAVFQQALEDARACDVCGSRNRLAPQLLRHEGGELDGGNGDVALEHVVAVGRRRNLPDVAAQVCEKAPEGLAIGRGNSGLQQPRPARRRGEHEGTLRQGREIGRLERRALRRRLDGRLHADDFAVIFEGDAHQDAPTRELPAREDRQEGLGLGTGPLRVDHRLARPSADHIAD